MDFPHPGLYRTDHKRRSLRMVAGAPPQPPGRHNASAPTMSSSRDALGVTGLLFSSETEAQPVLPSAEELAKVRWTRRPVKLPLEHLQATLEREKPLATEKEALALRNESEEENAKILSALGRTCPGSADEVDWDATCTRYMGSDPGTLNPIFRGNVSQTYPLQQRLLRLSLQRGLELQELRGLEPGGELEYLRGRPHGARHAPPRGPHVVRWQAVHGRGH